MPGDVRVPLGGKQSRVVIKYINGEKGNKINTLLVYFLNKQTNKSITLKQSWGNTSLTSLFKHKVYGGMLSWSE